MCICRAIECRAICVISAVIVGWLKLIEVVLRARWRKRQYRAICITCLRMRVYRAADWRGELWRSWRRGR